MELYDLTIMPSTGRVVHARPAPEDGRVRDGEVRVDLAKLERCPTCGTPLFGLEPVFAGCYDCR